MRETNNRDILQLVEPTCFPAATHPRLGIVGGGKLAAMTALPGLREQIETDRRR